MASFYTIRQLVETLNRFIDFRFEFDASKPTGVRKRLLDITLARQTIGYQPSTSLEEGLKKTWQWFLAHPEEYTQKVCFFEDDPNTQHLAPST